MRRLALTMSVAVAALPSAALADTQVYGSINVNGASTSDIDSVIYTPAGGLFGGVVEVREAGVKAVAPAPTGSDNLIGSWKTDTAVGVNGAIGVDFGVVRAEAEVSYARANVSGFNFVSATSGLGFSTTDVNDAGMTICSYFNTPDCNANGNTVILEGTKLRQLGVMGNVWVDLPLGGKLQPYVGGGLGMVGLESDGEGETAFSWQVGAGVAYQLNSNVAITADFRHRQTGALEFDFGGGEGMNFGNVKSNTYGLGMRFSF